MSFLQAVIWGLLEGLADLLPVSGSAHFAIFERLFGLQDAATTHSLFYAMLELGLLTVIVVTYRSEAGTVLRACRAMIRPQTAAAGRPERTQRNLFVLLLAGLLPLVLEFFLVPWARQLRTKCLFYALTLACSGLILFTCDYYTGPGRTKRQMRLGDALLIGLGQALSVLPGFSRTGLTIAAGYARRLRTANVVTYSFLLSIPYLFGAAVIHLIRAIDHGIDAGMLPRYLMGTLVCVVSGFFAMQILKKFIQNRQLRVFSYYCWGAAVFSAFLFLIT